MKLSDTAIRNAKAQDRQYKLADGNGLYILVMPTGQKYWRMDYRFNNKRKTLAFGVYPTVKLKAARAKCQEAKLQLADGIDPKPTKHTVIGYTFEAVAREWYNTKEPGWEPTHAKRTLARLETHAFPFIGSKVCDAIGPLDILNILRIVEERGTHETAHRLRQTCGQIFRYAVITERAQYDVTAALKDTLKPTKINHMATITDPKEVGALLRSIDGYTGQFITLCALKLAPLVFVRPKELRQAEWSEIDTVNSVWKIPSEKMKMRRPHIVPLSIQALQIIEDLRPYTEHRSKYLFPSIMTDSRPMSGNTVLAAIRRLGYEKVEMCGHGFRAMASTLLNENGWNTSYVEMQLAHAERNKVKAAYNHAEYLPERTKMMQWWADYLDQLKKTI